LIASTLPIILFLTGAKDFPESSTVEWLVAKRLEMLGFTFTGADSETLALAQDKYRVKSSWIRLSSPRRPGVFFIPRALRLEYISGNRQTDERTLLHGHYTTLRRAESRGIEKSHILRSGSILPTCSGGGFNRRA